VRWGLIGASDIAAKSIVPGIRARPGGRVVAVHSRSAERGAEYASRNGIDRSYDSLAALLADPEIDAVYVSTTNDRHAEETVAAVRAGRHVLCEKPLALNLDGARAMVAAADRAGVTLGIGYDGYLAFECRLPGDAAAVLPRATQLLRSAVRVAA
jgi:1,5-anhydro-D-fructose reductase (1,5-anhydro-D-mannitol-forming)